MRVVYNLLLYLILPFLPLRLLWRSRKNSAYRKRILERFAYFNFLAIKDSIWVHAVSVGETLAAVPLITALIQHYPQNRIVVTTMTPTGAEMVQKIFNNQLLHLYVPYDYPGIIKRFLRQINPKILVLMETELWPNILYSVAKCRIPIVLCNARLSMRSFLGYKKIAWLFRSILDGITIVMAQSKLDAERFFALGVNSDKLLVAGNVKFDISISDELLAQAVKLRELIGKKRPIWVAASTHKMEEEKILTAAKKVLAVLPDTLLILVPRHPERFDEVFDLGCQEGFQVMRYSNIQNYRATANVILGDVMGQLLLFYAVSDLAFVGGSLVPWSGHNLLEPAALAKPVLSGPNLSAFLEISQMMLDAHALVIVNDEMMLAQSLLQLFQDQALRERLGVAALEVVVKHRGATEKNLTAIKNLIGTI